MRIFLPILLALFMAMPAWADKCSITTQTEFSATTASAVALAQDGARACLVIMNKGSTSVYIKFDSAHSGTEGILLVANGSWEAANVPINSVYIKSASSTDTVTIWSGVSR